MKKFIIKSCFFVIPFLIFYAINSLYYKKDEGDLARLGFIYNNLSPFSLIMKQHKAQPRNFTLVSETNLDKKIKVDILTVGDSFSEQMEIGYQNQLSYHSKISILHMDRFLSEESPLQTLVELINSDFFNKVETKYVVLQSVERATIIRNEFLSFDRKRTIDSLKLQIKDFNLKKEQGTTTPPSSNRTEFFSDATIKIPLTNLQFLFLNRPIKSDVYKFKSNNSQLFTNNPKDLLFYKDDIKALKDKNNDEKIKALNDNLNKINDLLAHKNIKLIVLIAPDKYDLYYPYIANKDQNKEPLFFSKFEPLHKNYIYIPSYKILSEAIKREKDVYFYDDTHWTYKSAKIISDEIANHIQK